MIRSYRSLHRIMFLALGLLLAILLIASRGGPNEVIVDKVPPPRTQLPSGMSFGGFREVVLGELGLAMIRVAGSPVRFVEIGLENDLTKPDVLVYQNHGAEMAGAHLLGGLEGKLPQIYALGEGNSLIFYSLGHGEVLASTEIGNGGAQ